LRQERQRWAGLSLCVEATRYVVLQGQSGNEKSFKNRRMIRTVLTSYFCTSPTSCHQVANLVDSALEASKLSESQAEVLRVAIR
jgi:hypothetical protein